MPAAIPLIVGAGVATGAAATIGTAIAGAAISSAVATGIGAAVIGAGAGLATGQDVGEALTTGVVSGLTAGVGSSIGSAVAGAGTLSDAAFVAADAAQLAGQGLSQAAIAETLVSTGVSSATASTAASLAASGATEAAISSSLGSGSLFAQPTPPTDYSLLGGTSPEQLASMGETGLISGTPGEGLQLPQTPALPDMGGGQGLVVPVDGGFVGATGFTPIGATPSLGDPGSFINDPEVLGRPVIEDVTPSISITDALRGMNLANQLMGGGQQTATGFPQQQASFQPAGVDYSGILGLLGQRTSVPGVQGLLGPAQIRYPSLLG